MLTDTVPVQTPDAPLTHEDQIVAAIRQIIRAVDLHSRGLQREHGLTGPQLAVLQQCSRPGPTTPKSIANAVHLSQATITGILHRLEHRGLISRKPSDSDKRSVLIEVTTDGETVLQHSLSLLQDRFRRELAALEEWERLQILSTLQRVATLMGAETLRGDAASTVGDVSAEISLAVEAE